MSHPIKVYAPSFQDGELILIGTTDGFASGWHDSTSSELRVPCGPDTGSITCTRMILYDSGEAPKYVRGVSKGFRGYKEQDHAVKPPNKKVRP